MNSFLHLIIVGSWAAAAFILSLIIAAYGSEEARLAKQRGEDLRQRKELAFERNEIRALLRWEARETAIAGHVERLNLPIFPAEKSLPRTGVPFLAVHQDNHETDSTVIQGGLD